MTAGAAVGRFSAHLIHFTRRQFFSLFFHGVPLGLK
jgi:hypothetical protein